MKNIDVAAEALASRVNEVVHSPTLCMHYSQNIHYSQIIYHSVRSLTLEPTANHKLLVAQPQHSLLNNCCTSQSCLNYSREHAAAAHLIVNFHI